MANSLALGCDCLGVIHYFDAVFSSERGHPYVVQNAICMHEEDYGILWKHNDPRGDTQRRTPVASTGGEHDRHGRQLRLRLLLVLLPGRDDPVRGEAHRDPVDHGGRTRRAAAVRVDDRSPTRGARSTSTCSTSGSTPRSTAPRTPCTRWTPTLCRRARTTRGPTPSPPWPRCSRPRPRAQRVVDPSTSRCWKIVNPHSENRLGIPVAYKLVPGPDAHAARQPGLERRPAGRLRHTQSVGHSLRPRRTTGRGRLSQPARRRGRPTEVDGGGPLRRRSGHRRSGTPSASPTYPGPRTGR